MKSMKVLCAALSILFAVAIAPAHAVSGIGVTVWRIHYDSLGFIQRSLRLHKVTDSHVDTAYDVVTNIASQGDYSLIGHPVINTHGTHVAYVRSTGTQNSPEYRITIMRISSQETIDVAIFGNDSPQGLNDGAGNLAWPRGDWIYFATASLCRFLYRVNVQTHDIEFIALIDLSPNDNFGRELKMSAVDNRISLAGGLYFTIAQIQESNGIANASSWSEGGMFTVQGCGHTISASGKVMGNQVDPGHFLRIVSPLNWETHTMGESALIYPADRNLWSVDRDDPVLACMALDVVAQDSILESVGVGNATYGNAFSVNSDKWECLNQGWAPEGREGGGGRNLVLCNYTDSIALNVSRGPRRNNGSSVVNPACDISVNWYIAEEVGFFVSAPEEDIIPELREDARTDYAVAGLDDGTQLPELVMLPQTPPEGLPVTPVGIQDGSHTANSALPSSSLRIIRTGDALLIYSSAVSGNCELSVFDARGATVMRASGSLPFKFSASRGIPGPGLYVIKIRSASRTMTASLKVM